MVLGPFGWITLIVWVVFSFLHPRGEFERNDLVRKIVNQRTERNRKYRNAFLGWWFTWSSVSLFVVLALVAVGYFFLTIDPYYGPAGLGYGSTNFELILGFHFAALIVYYMTVINFYNYMYAKSSWYRRAVIWVPHFIAWAFELVAVVFIFIEVVQTGNPLETVTEVMAPIGSLVFLLYLTVYLVWYLIITNEDWTREFYTARTEEISITKTTKIESSAAQHRVHRLQ